MELDTKLHGYTSDLVMDPVPLLLMEVMKQVSGLEISHGARVANPKIAAPRAPIT